LKALTEESTTSTTTSAWFRLVILHPVNRSVKVVGGRIPDGKNVMNRTRQEAQQYKQNYGIAIPGNVNKKPLYNGAIILLIDLG
jgi:hypothetical protein